MRNCRIAGWLIAGTVMAGCLALAAPAWAEEDVATTRGFSVVVLLGEGGAGSLPTSLSEGARKALADIKDFLPYKSYRVLDDQWIVANDVTIKTSAQLRGVDQQRLLLDLRASRQQNGRLAVMFHLGDVSATASREKSGLSLTRVQLQYLEKEHAQLLERYGPKHPIVGSNEAKQKTARQALEAAEASSHGGSPTLMDTQFTLAVGETVVVGTSRIAGEKALIVLLTAVPRGAAAQTGPEVRVGHSGVEGDPPRFYISGYIKNPGSYAFVDGISVSQLIALAGGLHERGSDRNIQIKRLIDGKVTTIDANLDTRVQKNDEVKVPSRPQ